jgi:hypothetical protein
LDKKVIYFTFYNLKSYPESLSPCFLNFANTYTILQSRSSVCLRGVGLTQKDWEPSVIYRHLGAEINMTVIRIIILK